MRYFKRAVAKIKTTYHDIRNMTHVRELVLYPKETTLTKISFLLVGLWLFAPIYVLLTRIINHFTLPIFTFNLLNYLQMIGYIGIIIGIFSISRSILQAKTLHVSWKQYTKLHIIPILLGLFVLLSFCSALFSTDPYISFVGNKIQTGSFITYIAYMGLFMSAYQIINRVYIRYLLYIFITGGVILTTFTIINSESINSLFVITYQSSIFLNPNFYGYYLNILILSLVALHFVDKNKPIYTKIFYFIFLFLFTFVLIKNSSFGSYLGALFGIIFLSIFMLIKFPKEKVRVGLILVTFILASLSSSYEDQFLLSQITTLTNDTQNIIENNDQAPAAGSGRWVLWTNAYHFALERPIFGYGIDNLGTRYAEEGITMTLPHNEYLQIAASLGIPALIVYLSALAIHFIVLLQKRKHITMINIALYSVIFAYLVGACFGNAMYFSTPYYIVFLGISIAINQHNLYQMKPT